MNRKLARDVLEHTGYRTLEATTAEQGIELARTEQPALILMDIQLSEMNGIEAFRHLKRGPSTAHIPVVAFTASAMTQEQQEIKEEGFEGYVAKPISVNELVAKIEEILSAQPPAQLSESQDQE